MRVRTWIVICLLGVAGGWAHAFEWDSQEFMPLSEIRPGMLAEARTVFSGTKVESFDLRIVSIRDGGQGRHVIWGLGEGDRIEHTGVAQGMSGSPVYIDGRLIGAVAYTYPNAKDPWVGVTPIEEMLPILDRDMTPRVIQAGIDFGWAQYAQTMQALSEGHVKWPEPADFPAALEIPPERLRIPLMFAGFEPEPRAYLERFFAHSNMFPVQGGGQARRDVAYPLEPGQLVAMVYATGDDALYGYGTVTYRKGNQILAFGHPASNKGHTSFPIAGGWIDQVVASRVISFKVGSIGKINGTLVQDRISGIAGIIGETPSMTPLKVRVYPQTGDPREYNYQVFLGERELAAPIAGTLVWNSVESAERGSGDYTVDVQMKIDLEGYDPLVKHFTAAGSASPAAMAGLALQAPLAALLMNEFQPIPVRQMEVEVKLGDRRRVANIREVRLNKMTFRPGESIQATVVLQPYLEPPVTQPITIPIPDDLDEGTVQLMVTNAVSYQRWQQTRAPERYRPRSVQQLLQILHEGESGYNLIIALYVPKPGMTIQGEEYPELPFSMLYVMSSPAQSGEGSFTRGTTLAVYSHPTPYVLVGSRTLRITIDRNAY